jgi:tyrosyl-tRNA synthetase
LQWLKQQAAEGRNPRDVKFELAREIVARFHDQTASERAHAGFLSRFQRGQVPDDVKNEIVETTGAGIGLTALLKQIGFASGTTAAARLIEQGAVKVEGEKVTDIKAKLAAGATYVVQSGKRQVSRVTVN